LTAKQWQKLINGHPTMPMRYIGFPFTMNDSVEEIDYAIQLSQHEAGIPLGGDGFDDEGLFYDGGHPTVRGFSVDRKGQFYYGTVLYPFRKILSYFSIQNQRQLGYKEVYKKDLELYQRELKKAQQDLLHPAQSKWANPRDLREYLKKRELDIQSVQRAIDAPIPAPEPLHVALPFGMKPDAPALASRLLQLQATADKAGWPKIVLDIPAPLSANESADFPENLKLTQEQIREVEIIGSLTLSVSQWAKIRARYPFAHKRMWRSEFRMLSATQVAIAKMALQPDALGRLKQYLAKSEGVVFPVDGRGQFYSGSVENNCWDCNGNSLIPFQALLDAVRATHRERDRWGSRATFTVVLPPGIKSDSSVLKTRLDLLYSAAEKSGRQTIRSHRDLADD
jgi:hypothetical protein